jgi:hypothetical protein
LKLSEGILDENVLLIAVLAHLGEMAAEDVAAERVGFRAVENFR